MAVFGGHKFILILSLLVSIGVFADEPDLPAQPCNPQKVTEDCSKASITARDTLPTNVPGDIKDRISLNCKNLCNPVYYTVIPYLQRCSPEVRKVTDDAMAEMALRCSGGLTCEDRNGPYGYNTCNGNNRDRDGGDDGGEMSGPGPATTSNPNTVSGPNTDSGPPPSSVGGPETTGGTGSGPGGDGDAGGANTNSNTVADGDSNGSSSGGSRNNGSGSGGGGGGSGGGGFPTGGSSGGSFTPTPFNMGTASNRGGGSSEVTSSSSSGDTSEVASGVGSSAKSGSLANSEFSGGGGRGSKSPRSDYSSASGGGGTSGGGGGGGLAPASLSSGGKYSAGASAAPTVPLLGGEKFFKPGGGGPGGMKMASLSSKDKKALKKSKLGKLKAIQHCKGNKACIQQFMARMGVGHSKFRNYYFGATGTPPLPKNLRGLASDYYFDKSSRRWLPREVGNSPQDIMTVVTQMMNRVQIDENGDIDVGD